MKDNEENVAEIELLIEKFELINIANKKILNSSLNFKRTNSSRSKKSNTINSHNMSR